MPPCISLRRLATRTAPLVIAAWAQGRENPQNAAGGLFIKLSQLIYGCAMAYEVIARKWRPQVFQDVVGQEHVTQTLINAIKNERIAHAYLFGGPRGVGKTSVARIFAKAINCPEGEPGTPCNHCRSCLEITDGSSTDVQEIDGASNRGIDEIRELRENIKYLPSSGKYRVYIIDEVHMLTLPAFNALLKTLEEPPPHVKFLFATTESNKVPITILSRCQRFDFKRIPLDQLAGQLKHIAKQEGVTIGDSAVSLIARASEGSMRDAQSLLDQVISFTGKTVSGELVHKILGIIDRETLLSATKAVIEGNVAKCIEIIEELYNHGYDLKDFYRLLMHQFRMLLFCTLLPDFKPIEMTEADAAELRKQAGSAGETKLQMYLDFLIHREENMRQSSYPRLILETTLIKLCRVEDFLSLSDILKHLIRLEKNIPGPSFAPQPKKIMEDQPISASSSTGYSSPQKGEAAGKDVEKNWDDFIKFLSRKDRFLSTMINGAVFKGIKGEAICLEVGSNSFAAGYLGSSDKAEQISRLAQEFFGRRLRVELTRNASEPLGEPVKPSPASRKGDLESSPLVQGVLSMFDGEILREHKDTKEEKKI